MIDAISTTVHTFKFKPATEGLSPLTPRELQCLGLIAEGFSVKIIAARLFLSSETVNTHAKSIRRKLVCKNITEAVSKAYRYGLFNQNTQIMG